MEGSERLVPLSELEPVRTLTEMTPYEFRVALTRHRLENPVSDQFLSYEASKTKLFYHQFLPLQKLLESPDQRLLIADEVGTGKTIEAGLIWAELESRAAHGLGNVWIVCPKSLVGKWQEEMLQRFDFQLEILTSEGLRQALVSLERDGMISPRFSKSIVNLELIRLEDYAARLEQSSMAWDLTIFDEAHHLRNADTLSNAVSSLICERSRTAIFLTATPLQTHLRDIVNLMDVLGVDVAADPDLLEEQLRWDMRLNDCIRMVRHQPPGWKQEFEHTRKELESRGGSERLGWTEFCQLVDNSDFDDRRQRRFVVDTARGLQALNPYMTRTRRSDFDGRRPTREAITKVVQFSPAEEAFYEKVFEICLARARERGIPSGFVTQMPERRTASCVPAVASEVLKHIVEDEDEDSKSSYTQIEIEELRPLALAALESRDRKLTALFEMLDQAFGDLGTDRVMIFSTFRGTLRYLESKLKQKGLSVELMYGPTPARDEDCRRGEKSRERIATDFRHGKFQILLASEVAGEGLDFEHCHFVINYDLPWNPMRVEQRIGRCDRLGQNSDKVYIGNLASVGTIEERILSRLFERLSIFERALGDLEVVLGEAITSFEREVFKRGLTKEQQAERLEKISRAIERSQQHRESIEQSDVISIQGRQLIDSEQLELMETKDGFLSHEDLGEFVFASINGHLADAMRRTTSTGEFELAGNTDLNGELSVLQRSLPSAHFAQPEITRFRARLSQEEKVSVSFLKDTSDVEFVHVRHPLLLLAIYIGRETPVVMPWCAGVAETTTVSKPTMIVWAVGSLEGYTSRTELLCAAVDCETVSVNSIPVDQAQRILRAMSAPLSQDLQKSPNLETLIFQAEQTILSNFSDIANVFKARDRILTDKARQAVRSHAERQIRRNKNQLSKRDLNKKLKNMYIGWNRRLERESKIKMEEIERRSGIRSSLKIIGVALVKPHFGPQISI